MTDLETETALATQKHIELVMHAYTREQQIDIYRGWLKAFSAAYAALVGPREAFELFTEMADAEVFLSLTPPDDAIKQAGKGHP
jgi:hypothetical protein